MAPWLVVIAVKLLCGVDLAPDALVLVLSLVSFSSMLIVFCAYRWFTFDTHYLRSGNIATIILSAIAALSAILPSARFMELLPKQMTEDKLSEVFPALIDNTWGFMIIAVIVPLAEEVVFRGTILRDMLKSVPGEDKVAHKAFYWGAIASSAALFSVAHMNPAQMPHAFITGMFLGWLYARTGSIVPGVTFHFINNASAFAMAKAFPQLPYDAPSIEYFAGNELALGIAVAISIVVFALCLKSLNNLTTLKPHNEYTREY